MFNEFSLCGSILGFSLVFVVMFELDFVFAPVFFLSAHRTAPHRTLYVFVDEDPSVCDSNVINRQQGGGLVFSDLVGSTSRHALLGKRLAWKTPCLETASTVCEQRA